jgi:hypothetical protein
MKSLKYYIVLITMFFCGANLVYANLEITEIMYAPESGADYEWVEILNTGSSSVDLDKYRFFHGETTSGPITLKVGNNTILQSGEYAVVAKSLSDYSWLNTSAVVFSSSVLSLPDSGDNTYIAISGPDKNILNSVTYNTSLGGSKASKSSLSKVDGDWTSGVPTPGEDNQKIDEIDNGEDINEDDSEDITGSSSSSSREIPIILKVTTKIISPKIVLAKIPFSMSALTTTNRGETYIAANYIWNFGDGMTMKTKNSGPIDYLYEYPGEYAITLSYFNSFLDEEATATNKIIIKVIPSEIYISSVGDNIDPFIELENKSNYEIILSDWIITSGNHFFTIPKGTTILPGKKIKFSPKITGFTAEDLNFINITDRNKGIMANYPVMTNKIFKKSTSISSSNKLIPINDSQKDSLIKDTETINLNDLGASVDKAGINIPNETYPILGLSGIIGLGIISFLIIKRNRVDESTDKGIRAKDMTIVE